MATTSSSFSDSLLDFPVALLREQIVTHLQDQNTLILKAPAGSGKSTLVPQMVLDSVVAVDQSVWVLQPRRMAARMVAQFVARLRGVRLGEEVGFQVRNEQVAGRSTRLLFVTEGILMRRLLSGDPIAEIGAIVFDEFHERHLETDLSLALALHLRRESRPDLKLIIMSATADLTRLAPLLPEAPVIESNGRLFPVEIKHVTLQRTEQPWEAAASQLAGNRQLIGSGTALVFMPGVYEIQRTISAIARHQSLSGFTVAALYSALSREEQDVAVAPAKGKIVVTTNVAETSITIPGVTFVVDSGLARISFFDPRRGFDTLRTVFISQSSADQRCGRAGRTEAGLCIRLWSEFHHRQLPPADVAAIHRSDMAGVLLGLLAHPVLTPETFRWIEPPTNEALESAWNTLLMTGAITEQREITPRGMSMSRLPLHPRQSLLFLLMAEGGNPELGALAAVVAESPEVLQKADSRVAGERQYLGQHLESDLLLAVKLLVEAATRKFDIEFARRVGLNLQVARQLYQSAGSILRQSGFQAGGMHADLSYSAMENLRKAVFEVFADRLAVRPVPHSDSFRLAGGRSAKIEPGSMVSEALLVVATDLEETRTSGGTRLFIRQATAINRDWVIGDETLLTVKQEVVVDKKASRVVMQKELYFGDLLFDRTFSEEVDDETAAARVAEAVLTGEWQWDQPDEAALSFINRVNFAAIHAPHYQVPPIDEEALHFIFQQTFLGIRSLKELSKANLMRHLRGWLNPLQLSAVDVVAPETIELPHRRRPVRLRYDDKGGVVLSETIQAFYDCPTPITVAEGRVEVMYELLSPARRPVQLTRSLDEFWTGSYHALKKELKGRYPKHEWR